MADIVTKTETGVIEGVGDANEYGFANIKFKGEYGTLWLTTKTPTLMDTARENKGQVRIVKYVEKQAEKIDPKTGFPYVNRYLDSVEVPPDPNVVDARPYQPEVVVAPAPDPSNRDSQIHRQVAGKVIASLFGTPEFAPEVDRSWVNFRAMCNDFVRYVETGQ